MRAEKSDRHIALDVAYRSDADTVKPSRWHEPVRRQSMWERPSLLTRLVRFITRSKR